MNRRVGGVAGLVCAVVVLTALVPGVVAAHQVVSPAGAVSPSGDAGSVTQAPDCSSVEYEEEGGTKLVENVDQLQCLQADLDGDYRLVDDVDASGTAEWNDGEGFTPIGPFTGMFDGDGHTISGLTVDRDGPGVGLFATLGESAAVESVHLTNVDVQTTASNTGGLVGNCVRCVVVDVHVVAGTVTALGGVGGLVGEIQGGEVRQSSADVSVDGGGSGLTTRVGGLVGGAIDSEISQSYAVADVNTEGVSEVGGLVGESQYSEVTWSYATGSVAASPRNSSEAENVGGLVGLNNRSSVRSSYATADVRGRKHVGGLVGRNRGDFADPRVTEDDRVVVENKPLDRAIVADTYARANVSGGASFGQGWSLGGLVGITEGASSIGRSYATGVVDAGSGDIARQGGLVGQVGGFVWFDDRPKVEYNHFDTRVENRDDPTGVGVRTPVEDRFDILPEDVIDPVIRNNERLSTAEMRGEAAASSFHDSFAFGSTWTTVTDPDDYPQLTVVVEGHASRPYFEVSSMQVDGRNDTAVSIVASIRNTGNAGSTQTVAYRVDEDGSGTLDPDETRATRTGTIEDFGSRVRFDGVGIGDLAPGTYEHGVVTENASTTGELVVEGLAALDVDASPESIPVNQRTGVTVQVNSARSGEPLRGATVAIPELGAEAETGQSGTATLAVEASDPGEYELTVSLRNFEDVTTTLVVEVPGDSNPEGTTEYGLGPGFTVLGVILAVLLAVALVDARRRR